MSKKHGSPLLISLSVFYLLPVFVLRASLLSRYARLLDCRKSRKYVFERMPDCINPVWRPLEARQGFLLILHTADGYFSWAQWETAWWSRIYKFPRYWISASHVIQIQSSTKTENQQIGYCRILGYDIMKEIRDLWFVWWMSADVCMSFVVLCGCDWSKGDSRWTTKSEHVFLLKSLVEAQIANINTHAC